MISWSLWLGRKERERRMGRERERNEERENRTIEEGTSYVILYVARLRTLVT